MYMILKHKMYSSILKQKKILIDLLINSKQKKINFKMKTKKDKL